MTRGRLEAFSDAVLAIIMTIMVLELRTPEDATLHALAESSSSLLTYALSFVYIGIYWNNHHHFFQLVQRIGGSVLWANLHLLFWLSLIPFTTAWMDETRFAVVPVMVYGIDLLLCALAWFIMQQLVFRLEGADSLVRRAVGADFKGKVSPGLYIVGIGLSLVNPWIGVALYTVVAVLWLVPDRRFEAAVTRTE